MATGHKINFKLWAACSVVVLCLFVAFEPGIGLKAMPLRESLVLSLRYPNGQMPVPIVLEHIFAAMFLFGIPSAILGWVIHAIGIVVWSSLTNKNKTGPDSTGAPEELGQS